jgi:hypothetical protein
MAASSLRKLSESSALYSFMQGGGPMSIASGLAIAMHFRTFPVARADLFENRTFFDFFFFFPSAHGDALLKSETR